MIDKQYLENMTNDIQKMRRLAEHLKETGKGIETIDRNLTRILSSIRLLEMNVTDVFVCSDRFECADDVS